MTITLKDDAKKKVLRSIQRFFDEVMDEDYGDLKAKLVLDFCLKEIGPAAYNQGIADAQAYFLNKVEDLDGVCWEAEDTYWSEQKKSSK